MTLHLVNSRAASPAKSTPKPDPIRPCNPRPNLGEPFNPTGDRPATTRNNLELRTPAKQHVRDHTCRAPAAPPNAELVGAALRSMACRENPVHLYSIARALGVASITVVRHLDRPGHVAWVDGSPRIQLKAGTSVTRRRFALAHELGHVVLGHGAPETVLHPATPGLFAANERMADRVAAALLLPPAEIDCLRALSAITLQAVRDVADRQQVSFSVVVNRLRFTDPRPAILLTLRRTRSDWEVERAVGGVNGLDDPIMVAPDQFKSLEELPAEDTELQLCVNVGDRLFSLRGTANRRNSNVLALVNHVSNICTHTSAPPDAPVDESGPGA